MPAGHSAHRRCCSPACQQDTLRIIVVAHPACRQDTLRITGACPACRQDTLRIVGVTPLACRQYTLRRGASLRVPRAALCAEVHPPVYPEQHSAQRCIPPCNLPATLCAEVHPSVYTACYTLRRGASLRIPNLHHSAQRCIPPCTRRTPLRRGASLRVPSRHCSAQSLLSSSQFLTKVTLMSPFFTFLTKSDFNVSQELLPDQRTVGQ